MATDADRPLRLNIQVDASDPALLEGLEVWLRLGLITEHQVRQLSQTALSCRLPEPAVVAKPPQVPAVAIAPMAASQLAVSRSMGVRRSQLQSQTVVFLQRGLRTFQDELSVRWLLFLGVFLVVVSSGVLAATQWSMFPPMGQYGVLWIYTVVFGGLGIWCSQRENLTLTANTLKLVTLLLIPVNFWAIDSFSLGGTPLGWLAGAIATVSLAAITLFFNRLTQTPLLYSLAFLGLSGLHWGWSVANFPQLAVYLGAIATLGLHQVFAASTARRQNLLLVGFAFMVLLLRAIFVEALPISDLGLAIGIGGWLLTQNRSEHPPGKALELCGALALLWGWGVSVANPMPWQATFVSGLGLAFLGQRVRRSWRRWDLLALFIVGGQGVALLLRLIPPSLQKTISQTLFAITGYALVIDALIFSIAFAYLLGFIGGMRYLYRLKQPNLAHFGEWLGLGVGGAICLLGQSDPFLAFLFLLLWTLSFAVVAQQNRAQAFVLYCGHIIGLATLYAFIAWQFPALSVSAWAMISLGLMVVEWWISTLGSDRFHRSSWHLGFALAALSYSLFLGELVLILDLILDLSQDPSQVYTPAESLKPLLWFVTPLALTGVAHRCEARRPQAVNSSVVALFLAQVFSLGFAETRPWGLAIALLIMAANTYYQPRLINALIHLGFGIAFVSTLLNPWLVSQDWLLAGAIASVSLWGLYYLFKKASQRLTGLPGICAGLYRQAADQWAIALSVVTLTALTLFILAAYGQLLALHGVSFVAALLLGVAIAGRGWRQPQDAVISGIGWATELAVASAVFLSQGSRLDLATATIVLGLITLFLTEGLVTKNEGLARLTSLQRLPLVYAALGFVLRLGVFTPYSGLLTLGAALTGVGISRHRPRWKPITYLSIFGISVAWYELVVYQLIQVPGGNLVDGFTVFAGVAVAIALFYRLLAAFWQRRQQTHLLNLSLSEINGIAHLHWAIASLLMLQVILLAGSSSPQLTFLGWGILLLLAAYALFQGRTPRVEAASQEKLWVYAGMVQLLGSYVYARSVWSALALLDAALVVIVCLLAVGLYQLPWHRWGWDAAPWHHSAIALPIIALVLPYTPTSLFPVNLVVAAGFYGWLAYQTHMIRWTYCSLVLINLAIIDWFSTANYHEPLAYAVLWGFVFLYIAQVDPGLRSPAHRSLRHYLRLFGSGIMAYTALFFYSETGLIPIALGLMIVVAGLYLQVRAFLYMGTATFVLAIAYQFIVLILQYAFLKWVMGLMAGVVLIAVAANFERSRIQVSALFEHWLAELQQWD